MKIRLENREYELKANGRFMLKYQETFGENMISALYKAAQEKDVLACAKLTYCAITEELPPFNDWIDSFETPLFILQEMDSIFRFLTRSVEPSVKPNVAENDAKKKTTN